MSDYETFACQNCDYAFQGNTDYCERCESPYISFADEEGVRIMQRKRSKKNAHKKFNRGIKDNFADYFDAE